MSEDLEAPLPSFSLLYDDKGETCRQYPHPAPTHPQKTAKAEILQCSVQLLQRLHNGLLWIVSPWLACPLGFAFPTLIYKDSPMFCHHHRNISGYWPA